MASFNGGALFIVEKLLRTESESGVDLSTLEYLSRLGTDRGGRLGEFPRDLWLALLVKHKRLFFVELCGCQQNSSFSPLNFGWLLKGKVPAGLIGWGNHTERG